MVKVQCGIMMRKVLPFALAMSALALAGCGGDDKKDDGDSDESQYVVMPFVLGDTATINGATAENFSFKVGAAAAPSGLTAPSEHLAALHMNDQIFDHQARSLLNHFDRSLGVNQGSWFWKTARSLDAYDQMQAGHGPMALFAGDSTMGAIEANYFKQAQRSADYVNPPSFRFTAATCPKAGEPLGIPNNGIKDKDLVGSLEEPSYLTIPAGRVVDAADYCLVFIDDPVTAGDEGKVEETVKTVLTRYKTVIYKDQFAALSNYTFKPIIAVIDFGDATKWAGIEQLQIAGAFIPQLSAEEFSMPILYMASNAKNLAKSKDIPDAQFDKVTATKVWHGTVAHEMQHAVMDYYKKQVGGIASGEIPAIDEGLAHYMEDLFGYGTENFDGFAKVFLDSWSDKDGGAQSFLNAQATAGVDRGSAQSFWYYLISQKGGVEFSDGVPTGGGGLDFIAKAVMSKKIGVANLAEQFGGSWTDVVAGFYGALVLDGAKLNEGITVDAKYKVQDTQTITDLNGHTDKQYGMHFNGFGGMTDARTYDVPYNNAPQLEDVTYYSTFPVLYTGKGIDSVAFNCSDETAKNQGVAKIQIK